MPRMPNTSQLAVQMYTLRDYVKTADDFALTLKKISNIGYRAVQLSSIATMNGDAPEVSPEQARTLLDENNLRCAATHRSWDDLTQRTSKEIEVHQVLSCSYIALGSIPSTYTQQGLEGYRRWLGEALPLAERLKAAGIRFGYHNHSFEFETFGANRQCGYDIFLHEGAQDLMLELDVYWVAHTGLNPERIVERAAGRLPVVHLKDMEVIGNNPVMAPIGEGNLDWPHLLPALAAAGTEWYCVEQDECRRDPFDCLRSSFEYLTNTAAES
jgi:sugar phosphate isomerase/epimerase